MESPSKIMTMGGTGDDGDGNDNNKPSSIKPKLKMGKPGDQFEQGADAVADQVIRMSDMTNLL